VDKPRIASPAERGGDSSHWPPGILDRIVAGKRAEVERLRAVRRDLWRAASDAPPPRPVLDPLRRRTRVGVIAEVKRRSPGAGAIAPGLDPVALSNEYEEGGAFGVSVLTDTAWFGGSLEDLEAVRGARSVPVLRKDFVIDPVQVTEARAAGADMVLLIGRILEPALLGDLRAMIHDMGMTALVEVHDEWEVDAALEAGAGLVGVNNRNLNAFRTDLAVTERLARYVPGSVWFAVGRVALLRNAGLPVGPLSATAILEMATSLTVVLMSGLAVLGLSGGIPGRAVWMVFVAVALIVATAPGGGGRGPRGTGAGRAGGGRGRVLCRGSNRRGPAYRAD